MKKETKEALYSLLDLMDMLGSIEFINLDINKANSIRKEVLDVIGEKKEVTILDSNTEELLGILPMILLDVNKFPSAKEIMNFAEKCFIKLYIQCWLTTGKTIEGKARNVAIIASRFNFDESRKDLVEWYKRHT